MNKVVTIENVITILIFILNITRLYAIVFATISTILVKSTIVNLLLCLEKAISFINKNFSR